MPGSSSGLVTRWMATRHHLHQHSETKQTPLARYTASLDQVQTVESETLRLAFLWREERKVRRNATIALQNNIYQVDPSLAGRSLEIHYDPFDLSRLELYLGDQHFGTATVTIQNRQRHLKVERLVTDPPDPPKPQSSLDFLAALRQEYRHQQQQELGQLHFSRLVSDWQSAEDDTSDHNLPSQPALPNSEDN